MRPSSFLFGVMLAGLALATVACRGKVGSVDANSNLVGTWTRSYEGRVVQEITFTAAGTYVSFNPETGGARERGTYAVAPDGKSVTFNATDGAPSHAAPVSLLPVRTPPRNTARRTAGSGPASSAGRRGGNDTN